MAEPIQKPVFVSRFGWAGQWTCRDADYEANVAACIQRRICIFTQLTTVPNVCPFILEQMVNKPLDDEME
jgi:hypothetical protein